MRRIITPLTHFIAHKSQPLNEKALAGLPSKVQFVSSSVPSSLRSDSTYMSSQLSHKSETSSTGILESSSLDEVNSDLGILESSPNDNKDSFSDEPDIDHVSVGVCGVAPQTTIPTPPASISANKW
jgi:hypothetical protein